LSRNKGIASPSAIDCICCALGGSILLWLATIAVSAKQIEGIQSLILITFDITYDLNDLKLAQFPDEQWMLNSRELALFDVQGAVKPQWSAWDSPDGGTEGNGSFSPVGQDIEVVSFSGSFDPVTKVARRSVLIQDSGKAARATVTIQWNKDSPPKTFVVRVVSNNADARQGTRVSDMGQGIQVFAKAGELELEPLPQ